MLRRLLIANRGEIARRIIRTCRRLGVRDGGGLFGRRRPRALVAEADRAVRLGPAPARESYLDADKVLAAARQRAPTAIHPGYGFLSENAGFAEAVVAAGLVWVGPPPSAIRAMGLKDAAKRLMSAAGVPVTPGYQRRRPERRATAGRGRPHRLSRADQGGGGRRRQGHAPGRRAADFAAALASCPARGGGQLRRRPGADRDLRHPPAPHRGAGLRRHPRERRAPVRARLLPAAPPPEGDRGGARARHGRRDPRGGLRAAVRAARPSATTAPAPSSSSPTPARACAQTASGSWR